MKLVEQNFSILSYNYFIRHIAYVCVIDGREMFEVDTRRQLGQHDFITGALADNERRRAQPFLLNHYHTGNNRPYLLNPL